MKNSYRIAIFRRSAERNELASGGGEWRGKRLRRRLRRRRGAGQFGSRVGDTVMGSRRGREARAEGQHAAASGAGGRRPPCARPCARAVAPRSRGAGQFGRGTQGANDVRRAALGRRGAARGPGGRRGTSPAEVGRPAVARRTAGTSPAGLPGSASLLPSRGGSRRRPRLCATNLPPTSLVHPAYLCSLPIAIPTALSFC
jgi:hypothetical protein